MQDPLKPGRGSVWLRLSRGVRIRATPGTHIYIMEKKLNPCDIANHHFREFERTIHEACKFFDMDSGEFCSCPCHNSEDVALRLSKLFGYAPGQGIFRKIKL